MLPGVLTACKVARYIICSCTVILVTNFEFEQNKKDLSEFVHPVSWSVKVKLHFLASSAGMAETEQA